MQTLRDSWAILTSLSAAFVVLCTFLGWAGMQLIALTRSFEKFHASLEAVRLVAEQAAEKAEQAQSACTEHSKELAVLRDRHESQDRRPVTDRTQRVA